MFHLNSFGQTCRGHTAPVFVIELIERTGRSAGRSIRSPSSVFGVFPPFMI